MIERTSIYYDKAHESLAGAVSEYANGRFNNCANRCYYACFQAAVHALFSAGLNPASSRPTWSHEQVQAVFAGDLIRRRKIFPAELRDALSRTYLLRQTADYTADTVSEPQAERALRRTRGLIDAIQRREEGFS